MRWSQIAEAASSGEGGLVPQKAGDIIGPRRDSGFEHTWAAYKAMPGVLRAIPSDLTDAQAVEAMANAFARHGMTRASFREAAKRWQAAKTPADRDRAAGWITSEDGLVGCGLAMRVLVALSVQRGSSLLSLFPLFMEAAKIAAAGVHHASSAEPKSIG